MSKKKWGWKKLLDIRQKLTRKTSDWFDHPLGVIPVDWDEFNKLYFSSRPVIVECPYERWTTCGDDLMSLYAALRMSKDNRKVAAIAYSEDCNGLMSDRFYDAIVHSKDWKAKVDRIMRFKHIDNIDPDSADDWIAYANWSAFSDSVGDKKTTLLGLEILEWIETTHGFKDFNGKQFPRYYRHIVYPKKFVILWDATNKDGYNELKEKFGKKFLFIDYTREKKKVDDWFKENDTILDPMFDISFSEPGLDMKKVFTYLATNYLYKLREYAKLFPDTVGQYFNKEELGEIGCKFGPPYDRYNYGK
jgi:hypothetical protein